MLSMVQASKGEPHGFAVGFTAVVVASEFLTIYAGMENRAQLPV